MQHNLSPVSALACLLLLFAGPISGIDVHFEDATSGFFIREAGARGTEAGRGVQPASSLGASAVEKSLRNLTVFGTRRSVTIKSSHGPFLSRQTISVANIPDARTDGSDNGQPETSGDLGARLADLSAHIVTTEVRKDRPVLRVLFHSSRRVFLNTNKKNNIIILVSAVLNNKTVEGVCSAGHGDTGTCLAQLTLPSHWWPPLASPGLAPAKTPRLLASLYYSVRAAGAGARVLTPPRAIGEVTLTPSGSGYQQLAGDELLHLLVPQSPLYPGSRLYVPVFMEQPPAQASPVAVIVIKCRARRGVRIQGIEETSGDWTLRMDINNKGSVATVTAFKKDASKLSNKEYAGPHELFNWLYAIDESETELWEGGLLVWHIKYQHLDPDKLEEDINLANNTKSSRLRHRLDIKKDDVQIVLPISKSWELMNTAVLTGRQVSQSMKAGSVADVTLHTSCSMADHSALKVSTSCTSVYVDGSETRGALRAQVDIKYGTFSGQAHFTVWMAETPLELDIPDDNLSQIQSWKIPTSIEKGYQKRAAELRNNWRDHFEEQTKKFDEKRSKLIEEIEEDEACQTRFQQTTIKVFARFLAEDPDSGRRDYLISRNTFLDVTDLTLASVRASDPRVASVTGNIIQGHTSGAVNITILSPITNQVLVRKEINVTKTKEMITGLKARVLSGISMAVSKDPKIQNQFTLETLLSEKLSSKYQEGLLDITVLFSDGSSTPLRDIDPAQYYLTVDTLDSRVIAFAPIAGSKDTRVIAVGRGQGDLLSVSLELADDCHDKNDDPLSTSTVYVDVDFEAAANIPQAIDEGRLFKGRKGRGKKRKDQREQEKSVKSVNMGDLSAILPNVLMKDEHSRVSSGLYPQDARPGSVPAYVPESGLHHAVTPLEVGMYILLAVFCVAIAVFMASCFVYASKHQAPGPHPLQRKSQSVQNAHDWVWLGRQTLDKSSVATSGSRDCVLDNNANSLASRDTGRLSHGQPHYPPHGHGYRFEATADVNITQNPVAGPEYGFVNKRGLKQSNYSQDVYAELPRKRWPRSVNSPGPELYQNAGHAPESGHSGASRSPCLARHRPRHQDHRASPASSLSTPSLERVPGSLGHSSRSSQCSRVNSATYTRKRPVVPSLDPILPVGYPVFSSQPIEEAEEGLTGFQNPWEALQMYRNTPASDINNGGKLHEFFEDDDTVLPLKLDLTEAGSYDIEQPELRQSPASALPPYEDQDEAEMTYVASPDHGQDQRSGHREYIPLNPDIDKPHPPRKGASKMFPDPFNVSDDEAPPVTRELLSPSHVFSSVEDISRQFAEAATRGQESETDNCSMTDLSGAEDNCSSVCSADSGELEMEEDTSQTGHSASASPAGSLSRRAPRPGHEMVDNASLDNSRPGDLNSVPLGSLDYEHLMNYFESLKESAA